MSLHRVIYMSPVYVPRIAWLNTDEKLVCRSRLPITNVPDGVDFIAEDSIEKTVRLMISYGGISPSTFWNALKERLEPPLAKVHNTQRRPALNQLKL